VSGAQGAARAHAVVVLAPVPACRQVRHCRSWFTFQVSFRSTGVTRGDPSQTCTDAGSMILPVSGESSSDANVRADL
jgi:hypothetical protein